MANNYSESKYDMAGIFIKFIDKNGVSVYNINDTFNIALTDTGSNLYTNYVVLEGDSYQTISYRVYGTTRLWWLIAKMNNVTDATELPVPGEIIRILNKNFVSDVCGLLKN